MTRRALVAARKMTLARAAALGSAASGLIVLSWLRWRARRRLTGSRARSPTVTSLCCTELYERLGVSPDATAQEIKSAFRSLALRSHPDKGGDAERFQEVQEAFDILGDTYRRRLYHRLGLAGALEWGDLDLKAQMIVLRDVRATVDAAINLRVLLRPRIDDERCLRVVRADLGAQWLEAIRPSLDAVVRARVARYATDDIIDRRHIIIEELRDAVQRFLEGFGLVADDVGILDVNFSEAVTDALQRRRIERALAVATPELMGLSTRLGDIIAARAAAPAATCEGARTLERDVPCCAATSDGQVVRIATRARARPSVMQWLRGGDLDELCDRAMPRLGGEVLRACIVRHTLEALLVKAVEGDLERELRDQLTARLVRAGLCVRGLVLVQFELSRELAAAIKQKQS